MNKWSREPQGGVEPQGKKLCVLVVGMHRSGTSALTRTLNFLGCDLPQTLMVDDAAHNASNPEGHWESAAIAAFNDRVLASAGSTWRDCQPFNQGWYASPRFEEFKAQAREILASEFGASSFFVLKDPRVCKLLPFWLEVLEEAGVEPLVVSIVRDPTEVAASLEARNGLLTSYGELLWLRYVLDGEAATRSVRRAYVGYGSLLSDWRGACERLGAELGVVWPRQSDAAAVEIDSFLNPQLRHHTARSNGSGTGSSRWVNDARKVLDRWAVSGEDAEGREALDRVHASFDEVLSDLGGVVDAGGYAMASERKQALQGRELRAQLVKVREEAERAATSATKKLAEFAERIAQADASQAKSKRAAADWSARLAAAQEELEQERAGRERSLGEAAEIDAQLKARVAEVADISRRLSAARQAAAVADKELEQRQADLVRVTGEIAIFKDRIAWADAEIERHRTEIERHRVEAERQRTEGERNRAEAERHRAASEANAAALVEARGAFAAESERRAQQILAAETKVVEREAEIARRALEAERAALELGQVRGQLAELELGLERRLLEGQAQAVELAVIRGRNTQLEAELLRNVDRVASLAAKLAVVGERLEVARQEVSRGKNRLSTLNTEKRKVDSELAKLRERLESQARARRAEIEQLEGVAAARAAALAAREAELEALREHLEGVVSARATALAERDAELEALRDHLRRLSVRRLIRRLLPGGRAGAPPRGQDDGVDREAVRLVGESDLFDATWYGQRDPALAQVADLAEHYVLHGGAEGRPASPRFDSARYLEVYSDVRECGANPLVHYLRFGRSEGREIFPLVQADPDRQLVIESGLFDADLYLKENADVAAAEMDPLDHFLLYGGVEGRRPSTKFNGELYLAANPDVAAAECNPLLHYLHYGRDEGRPLAPKPAIERAVETAPAVDERLRALVAGSGLFDATWYISKGAPPAGMDPVVHYLTVGAAQGRDPGPKFDARSYLEANPDVREVGLDPLVHYIRFGRDEGRLASPKRLAVPAVALAPRTEKVEPAPVRIPNERLWTRAADLSPREGLGVLSLNGAPLGLWSSDAAEPPVALGAFLRLARLPLAEAAVLRGVDGRIEKPALVAGVAVLDDDLAGLARLADLWFTNDHGLRLRVEGVPEAGGCVVRLYQADPGAGGQPLMIAEAIVADGEITFLDVALANPYAPLLIGVTTTEGVLAGAGVLPFPSLARGGAHAAELAARGGFSSLKSVSNALVQEHLGWAEARAGSIGTIEVDLEGACGAERVFSPPFKAWLAQVFGLSLKARPVKRGAEGATRAHLEASLIQDLDADQQALLANREAEGELTLTLPADALPTLAALVSRRLGVPSGLVGGGYLVADDVACVPRWAVSMPQVGESLLALQPKGAPLCFPLLEPRAGATARPGADAPLAIRYHQLPRAHEASLLLPISLDTPGPVLRSALSKRQRKGVSVLVAPSGDGEAFGRLLESLAQQTNADEIELVVALAAGADATVFRQASEAHFAGRHQILEGVGDSRSGRLNGAAAAAKGPYLLVADETMLLVDPRTVETLCLMASDKSVATAACVVVREGFKKGAAVRFHSGGFYPSHLAFQGAPRMIFNEPESLAAFPLATYPVAGNALRLALVRADAWKAVGGLDASLFPGVDADLDLSLRALASGYRHLCTSGVTAVSTGSGAGRDHLAEVLDVAPATLDWGKVLSSAAVIRRLD